MLAAFDNRVMRGPATVNFSVLAADVFPSLSVKAPAGKETVTGPVLNCPVNGYFHDVPSIFWGVPIVTPWAAAPLRTNSAAASEIVSSLIEPPGSPRNRRVMNPLLLSAKTSI